MSAPQPVHELLFWSIPDGVQIQGNWKTYMKVLLEDHAGEKVFKGGLDVAVPLIQKDMIDRVPWRKLVKSKCK